MRYLFTSFAKPVFLFLVALTVSSTPSHASIYEIETGAYTVYGDFSKQREITGTVTYSYTGGGSSKTFDPNDTMSTWTDLHIAIHVDGVTSVYLYEDSFNNSGDYDFVCRYCYFGANQTNQLEIAADYGISSLKSLLVSVDIDAAGRGLDSPVDLHVFLSLPDGFSLTAPVVAVPEPSTWVSLLCGFCLLGAAGRLRHHFSA